jgi:AraC-like DNA-binding protein
MTTTPMKSVTQLRAMLEGFAARHAAMRVAGEIEPREVLDRFRRMRQAAEAGNYRRFAEADRALHRSIIELADVPGLEAAWRAAFEAQSVFRLDTLRRCWPDLMVLFEAHRELADAVCAGDADEAENAALVHLDAVWFRLADATDDQSLPRDPYARTCAYLAFHFHEPVRLPQLAAEIAGCSPGHLARLFREESGLGFSDYLIELRLQKAADLLRRTQRSVAQVASRVGYADASRFAAHFRRRFGQTPGAFRRLRPS